MKSGGMSRTGKDWNHFDVSFCKQASRSLLKNELFRVSETGKIFICQKNTSHDETLTHKNKVLENSNLNQFGLPAESTFKTRVFSAQPPISNNKISVIRITQSLIHTKILLFTLFQKFVIECSKLKAITMFESFATFYASLLNKKTVVML